MRRSKQANAPWSSVEAATAECQRVLGEELCRQLIAEFREARHFGRLSKWSRGEARATGEAYRQIVALGPKLRTLKRWLKPRIAWAAENVPTSTYKWIFEGLDLLETAKNTLDGTRYGPRDRAVTVVVVDHLVKTGRAQTRGLSARTLALLAIVSGVEPCPRGAGANDQFERARKRWDEALRAAKAGGGRSDFNLSEFLEASATKNDTAS